MIVVETINILFVWSSFDFDSSSSVTECEKVNWIDELDVLISGP